MKILAALFIDDISMFENENGLTRLNLSGVQFTIAVSEPFPLTLAPHLVVLIHSDQESNGAGVLEVTYHFEENEIARNVQPLQIEPGLFAYRLIRAELELVNPGKVFAHCRLNQDDPMIVPLTIKAA
tara:strand:- start:52 stop:432 length:381 start_codon:yes stop_codon:yes gene_type:complete